MKRVVWPFPDAGKGHTTLLTEPDARLANLREVGGAGLQFGRRRTVYRANTEKVAPEAYPPSVATVIDLRRDDEIATVAHPLADAAGYRSIPLFDPMSALEATPDAETLEDQYVDWLERHRMTIAQVFRAIARTDGDVLVCCSAGKDRTGLVSALLARLWGADLTTVGEDYAATGPALAERFARERAETTDLERTIRNQRCVPEIATHVIRTVEQRHGSVRGYLGRIGLSDSEIDGL